MSKQAGELAKLQDFFPPGARDVTASPLGRAPRNQGAAPPPRGAPTGEVPRRPTHSQRSEETAYNHSVSKTPPLGGTATVGHEKTSVAHLESCKRKLVDIVATYQQRHTSLATLAGDVFMELFESAIRDVAFEAHHSAKFSDEAVPGSGTLRSWVENMDPCTGALSVGGYDVYGRQPPKVPVDVLVCESCSTKIGAAKFAQHLAKCMGVGGRPAGRGASRRAAQKMQQYMDTLDDPVKEDETQAAPAAATNGSLLDAPMDFNEMDFDESLLDDLPAPESEEEDDDDDFDPSAGRSKRMRGGGSSKAKLKRQDLAKRKAKRKQAEPTEEDELFSDFLPEAFI